MRRILAWTAVWLLVLLCAGLLIVNLPFQHSEVVQLSMSEAAQRQDERMSVPWPKGNIDVNNAGVDDLQRLTGVGPVLAGRIVEEREANGRFHYPEDLLAVDGIGQKTLMKFWEQICLPNPNHQ